MIRFQILVSNSTCAASTREPTMTRSGRATTRACSRQGLALVHFSAYLKPCLTQENPLHTLNTPKHPLNTGYTTPWRTPYAIQSAQVELKSGREEAPGWRHLRGGRCWCASRTAARRRCSCGRPDWSTARAAMWRPCCRSGSWRWRPARTRQGLTLVHFSAQPEPFLIQKKYTLNTPYYPLLPCHNP